MENHLQNLAQVAYENFEHDATLCKAIKLLIFRLRDIFVKVLQEPEMKSILIGSLFGATDNESELLEAWTNICKLVGISRSKYDDFIVPYLNF